MVIIMAKLHFLKSVEDTINTSIAVENGSSLIMFDGGHGCETEYLHEYLLGLGGHIDAWFLTHAHDDHVQAIYKMLDKYDDVTVDKVCYNFPSDEWLIQNDGSGEGIDMARNLRRCFTEKQIPTDTVHVGDFYEFDGMTVRVLRVPDETITGNSINNSSTVYRMEADGKSVLILGDLGVEGGYQLLEITDPSLIKADYVQLAHHGQNGVTREVYEAIRPSYCLWATPTWLWNNWGNGGYDTGCYNTVVTRGWISAMHCVKRHYLMQEGSHVIELGDEV